MDTRSKILSRAQAAETIRRERAGGRRVRLLTGYFDPLLAAHARRLEEVSTGGALLVVAVTDPPRPLLPAWARAELVAALAVVDYVFPAGEATLGVLEELGADEVLSDEAADEGRTRELIRHVHSRQQTP